jgi:outer membrane protein assembly factor BamB
MHCIDLETHEPVWSMDILEAFAAGRPHWGVAQSPLYHEGRVYVAPQGETTVVALDADTGGIIWKSARMSGGSCYVSPVLAEVGGVLQVVMLTAKAGDENPGQVAGFRADTGETLWQYDGYQCDIPIPYPKPLDDGRFFITGEYGAGSAMIRVTRQGEAFSVEELYKTQDCGSQIHQPLLVGDHLYANSNGNRRRDGLVCMALDGTRKWRTRDMDGRPIFEKGGLLLADGMIFIMEGDDGTLHLVEPSTEGYRELASARVFSGKLIWAPMALSDGRLVLRDQKQMKCLDVRAQAAP